MNPAMVLKSSVFPSDAPCPDGYVLVESAPATHQRSMVHLAPYESVSALARGVMAATAHTLCGYPVTSGQPTQRGASWKWIARKQADGSPRRVTCLRCLTEIRKALA